MSGCNAGVIMVSDSIALVSLLLSIMRTCMSAQTNVMPRNVCVQLACELIRIVMCQYPRMKHMCVCVYNTR